MPIPVMCVKMLKFPRPRDPNVNIFLIHARALTQYIPLTQSTNDYDGNKKYIKSVKKNIIATIKTKIESIALST